MALIKCTECKKQVSDKAKSCPHCGFPLIEEPVKETKTLKQKLKESKRLKKILIRFALSFFIFLLIISPIPYGSRYDGTKCLIDLFRDTQSARFLLYIILGLIIAGNFFLSLISSKLRKANRIIDIFALFVLIIINVLIVYGVGVQLTLFVYPLMFIAISLMILLNKSEDKDEKTKKKEKILLIILISICLITSIIFSVRKVDLPLDKINKVNQVTAGKKLIAIVDADYVNVRMSPDTNSNKITIANNGDRYVVLEIVKTGYYRWYQIKSSTGEIGFIANPLAGDMYLSFALENEKDAKDVIKTESVIEDNNEVEVPTTTRQEEIRTTTNNWEYTTTKKKTTTKQKTQSSNDNKQQTTTKTTIKTTTADNKAACNKKVQERTAKYNSDVAAVDSKYNSLKSAAKNEMDSVKSRLDAAGGSISTSYYNSRKRSISSSLSAAQTNLQRAMMDSSGSSSSAIIRYQNEIRELTAELSELNTRYDLTMYYEDTKAKYNEVLEDYKYALQKLYNDFSRDIDTIEASC